MYWPINLWFSRFQLTERGTIGPGYIWNGVFQITIALVVLITVASARRFRPVASAPSS